MQSPFDVSKAFDKVNQGVLFVKLMKRRTHSFFLFSCQ